MWSDRKQQEDAPITVPSQSGTAQPASEAPVGSARRTLADESKNTAVIGVGMVIRGQIRSAEHIHVAGEIEGSLNLPGYDLLVSTGSQVRANVLAREVEISGVILGNVDATRKITVRTGGRLVGDLRTPGIVIEDGAYFKGNIEIVTREARPPASDPATPTTRAATA